MNVLRLYMVFTLSTISVATIPFAQGQSRASSLSGVSENDYTSRQDYDVRARKNLQRLMDENVVITPDEVERFSTLWLQGYDVLKQNGIPVNDRQFQNAPEMRDINLQLRSLMGPIIKRSEDAGNVSPDVIKAMKLLFLTLEPAPEIKNGLTGSMARASTAVKKGLMKVEIDDFGTMRFLVPTKDGGTRTHLTISDFNWGDGQIEFEHFSRYVGYYPSGDDFLATGRGGGSLSGGNGNDHLYGNRGRDYIKGDGGNDRLWGGHNDDELLGGLGEDVLTGGQGQDILSGGPGNDKLIGGHGQDVFLFKPGFEADIVIDFKREDKLHIEGFDDVTPTDILALATQSGSDVVFTFNETDSLILENFTKADLTLENFK